MYNYICKAKYLNQNEEIGVETFQVRAKTKEEALERAHYICDKTANDLIWSFKKAAKKLKKKFDVNIVPVFTGEFQEEKFALIGDNGIIVGPMTEYDANERKFDLMYDYPNVKFEIKEVK